MRRLLLLAILTFIFTGVTNAQRFTDKVDRGLVAVPSNNGGYLVSWRLMGEEYYDTKYNLYRDGALIASDLTKTNFLDGSGKAASVYQVEPVVRGKSQGLSDGVKAWAQQYLSVPVLPVVNRAGKTIGNAVTNGDSNTSGYILNDVTLADVDGDGIVEFIVKRNNVQGNLTSEGNKTDFNLYECYKMDGTRLWWIDLGPNLMAGPDEQWDMIGYDWDQDGRAEMLMRAADNMIIHTASGRTINIGDMNYYAPRFEYTRNGREYLLYLNGETGEPYGWDGTSDSFTPEAFPLPRFEQGEAKDVLNPTDAEYKAVWGDNDTGHRSLKIYMGAPYIDGRNPAIFLGRGCYTRHKFCALSVDPATHKLTQLWRWNCYDSKSAWFGNGFHNFAIADVDMDGRDEIVFGSMIIDDTGYGLCTTGYGHGDAQHCGDLDPYRWGLEQFTCLEGLAMPNNCYYNATTGEVYYQASPGSDDGRCLAGNFTNDIPGCQGRSVATGIIALSADKVVYTNGDAYMAWGDLNNRIYWDGDLCDEIMNSPGVQRSVKITKWGNGRMTFYNSSGLYTPTGILNNSSKNNPSAQGDIIGDWREELVLRTSDNSALHVYTTNYASDYGIYTLWHDHEYRNGMAWQCVGYNQPPHVSYFLGELEGITQAPPPLMLNGRTEVGATISTTSDHLLVSGYEDKTIAVEDGAEPYILTVNTPAWVQGSGSQQATSATPKSPARTIINYTTTLTGGAFSGATRLVKQGEGTLVLPNVTERHTGETSIWQGTLRFDGTMEASPVWLNRHTTLLSDGGRFMGGLRADYGATIHPCAADAQPKQTCITVSTLTLGFGSRVVLDAYNPGDGFVFSQFNAQKLVIDTRDWENGPKYKAPVIQFAVSGDIVAGRYLLGTIAEVVGDIDDIVLEGIGDKRHFLSLEDGQLYLVVEDMRAATTVVWNGTSESSIWDFGVTKNFLNDGKADYAGQGDDVVFDDEAQVTNVVIKGGVRPKSVTFNNEKKAYTLTGDSILGGATITKNGAATVTINTENRTGATYINGGRLVVNMLANKSGQTYGALGDANQVINITDAMLTANGTITTDQPFKVGGDATIDVPKSMALTMNNSIKGVGATVIKTGEGSFMMGQNNTFTKLVVKTGTVRSQENSSAVIQVPDTIELQGGTFSDVANENTYSSNRVNFVVPAGKTGTFYGDPRCEYTGTLTGAGTFNVYGTWIRCRYKGDWSQFEGTVVPGVQDRSVKHGYDPEFSFCNNYGLPKATLKLNDGITVYNRDPESGTKYNVELGNVTGTGTLAGGGTYTIGMLGKNMIASFHSTAPIVKRGEGYLQVSGIGNLSGAVTVEEGQLRFNDVKLEQPYFGAVTLKEKGTMQGGGLLPSLTMESGTEATAASMYSAATPRIVKVNAAANVKKGATFNFVVKSATLGQQSAPGYSQLNARFLTFNGTVKVTLADSYTPKAGDELKLWNATSSFSGTPEFELPELPSGLWWDTTGMAQKSGVLRITDVAPDAIAAIAADAVVDAEIYDLGGTPLGTVRCERRALASAVRQLGLRPGLYIARMQQGQHRAAETIVVGK